jgi:hypothetical protein
VLILAKYLFPFFSKSNPAPFTALEPILPNCFLLGPPELTAISTELGVTKIPPIVSEDYFSFFTKLGSKY